MFFFNDSCSLWSIIILHCSLMMPRGTITDSGTVCCRTWVPLHSCAHSAGFWLWWAFYRYQCSWPWFLNTVRFWSPLVISTNVPNLEFLPRKHFHVFLKNSETTTKIYSNNDTHWAHQKNIAITCLQASKYASEE